MGIISKGLQRVCRELAGSAKKSLRVGAEAKGVRLMAHARALASELHVVGLVNILPDPIAIFLARMYTLCGRGWAESWQKNILLRPTLLCRSQILETTLQLVSVRNWVYLYRWGLSEIITWDGRLLSPPNPCEILG